jgi:hypothetical protein
MRKVWFLVAMAFVASCGGGDLSPRDALLEARTKTGEVKTYRVAMSGTTTAPGAGEIAFEGDGEFAGGRGRMTMDMQQVGEIEIVMAGLVMYMRMELLRQQAPELKPWIEIDLRRVGEEIGVDFQALMQLSRQQDPTQSLQQLEAAGEVEEVGAEDVRGQETTHYKTTIDLERQAELVEQDNPEAAKSIRKTIQLTGQRRVPMDVWVDSDQLVRRLKWTQKTPAGEQQATTTMTMELYDFGADIEIELPPRDQVMTFEELMELADQEGSG